MTAQDVMERLKPLGDAKMRAIYVKNGAGENLFGVKMGDLRAIAKEIKVNHELGSGLWQTGNIDAMMLATLVMKPKELSESDLDAMIGSVTYPNLADWFLTNIVKLHPGKEALRQKWMASSDMMRRRAGWSLTTERVIKKPEGLDFDALLDRIEAEMATEPEPVQWTMNFCLGQIGITSPSHRDRAIAIGEKLGVFRDYPTPKGCTSPFVPTWVAEMVKRNG